MTRTDGVRRSLARISRAAVLLSVVVLGCELDEGALVGELSARVVVAPKSITLRNDQVADFLAVGLTPAGDTATIAVTWSATGGTVIGTSNVGSRHYAQFQAGIQPGTFAVVATGHPGEDSDTALVTVTTVGVASVTVAPATPSVSAGSTVQLTATPKDAAGNPLAGRVVTWMTNAPTIAIVSTTGRVTGMAVGSATITGTSEGVSGTAAVTVTAAVLATYYVAPTGNDADPGTEVAPFKTIQQAASLVNPGDVVIVEDGVYTDHNGDGAVFKITRGGTAGGKVTFKARNRWGAKLDGQNGTTANGIDFDNGIGYVRVEGFDIFGVANRGSPTTGRGSASGIDLYDGGHTSEIVGNHIHNVGQVCTLSTNTNGQVAIFLQQPNVTVEQNLIHDIGRFFPGENGCTYTGFTGYQTLDHGIYLNGGSPGADGALIRNNVFYNTRHGWAVQMYPGSLSNVNVLNNTFAFGNPNKNYTHIVLDATISGTTIANNIFYNPEGGKTIEAGGFSGTITISTNITMGTAMTDRSSIPAGMLLVNNRLTTDPLFVNALGGDFHLLAGSPAIDGGLSVSLVTIDFDGVVRPRGAAHDIGAYEF